MTPSHAARWTWSLYLVFLVFVVYSPSLLNGFVWDDHFFIQQNAVVQGRSPLVEAWTRPIRVEREVLPMWRPLPLTLYAAMRQLFGTEAYPFHLLSIAMHAGAMVLFFIWLTGFGLSRRLSFVASAMVAVHPFLTSAVGYISGMADPLAAFLSLAALLLWRKSLEVYEASGPDSIGWQRWMAGACVIWLAALFCKEWALLVPLVAACALSARAGSRFRWAGACSAAFIAGIYACSRSEVFEGAKLIPGLGMGWLERLACGAASFGFYQLAGLLPFNLRMDRYYSLADPAFWAWYAAGAVFILFWLVAARRFGPMLLRSGAWRGLAWFLLFWFIQSNIPFALNAHLAEHWMYFAYPGLAWAAADLWTARKESLSPVIRQSVVIACVGLGIFWAGRGFVRQSDWRDDFALFESNIRAGADTSRSHRSLALAHAGAGRFREAIPHFLRAIERDPRHFRLRWELARCYYFSGDYAKAVALASELRGEFPDDPILQGFEATCQQALEQGQLETRARSISP